VRNWDKNDGEAMAQSKLSAVKWNLVLRTNFQEKTLIFGRKYGNLPSQSLEMKINLSESSCLDDQPNASVCFNEIPHEHCAL